MKVARKLIPTPRVFIAWRALGKRALNWGRMQA